MAIFYVCSMDQYGEAGSSNYWANGGPGGWTFSNDILFGDGWTSDPSYVNPAGSKGEAEGEYAIKAPSWGARGGDYALVADGVYINQTSFASSNTLTEQATSCCRLAIPGASQTTRIIHFAFGVSQLPDVPYHHGQIVSFQSSLGSIGARLVVDPSGRLVLLDGSAMSVSLDSYPDTPTVLLSTASPVISAATWYSLNIRIVNNGDGTQGFELWVGDISDDNKVMSNSALSFTTAANIDMLGFLPASLSYDVGGLIDTIQRAVRDIVLSDTTGTYNATPLGQVFVAAQEIRAEDSGGGWGVRYRQTISTGILDSVANSTGVRAPDAVDYDVGAGDFSFDTLVRFNSIPDASIDTEMDIVSRWRTDTNDRSYRLYYDGVTGSLKFDISTDGTAVTTIKEIPWDVEKWRWYHVAVARWSDTSGSYTSLFVDGVEIGVPTADTNTYYAANAAIGIGAKYDDAALDADTVFKGWLDETRICIGSSKYTTNFTPETEPYARSGGDMTDCVLMLGYDGSIADESPAANTVAVDGSNPVTAVEPGDDTGYKYTVLNQRPAWDDTYVEATNYFAQSVLTLTANPTDGETITIGAKTYTLVNTFDTVPTNQIMIGATISDTLDNITAAVNGGTGEGTLYGTGTTTNLQAVAVTYATPQLILRALSAGESTAATTETLANGYFDGATLSGGTDIPADSDFSLERLGIDTTGVLAAQMTARASKSGAGSSAMRFDLIGPSAGVSQGDNLSADLNASWHRQVFEEDPDTNNTITPSTLIGGRVRFKRVS